MDKIAEAITKYKNDLAYKYIEGIKLTEAEKELYEAIQTSKSGYITIEKISDNEGYLNKGNIINGFTPAFGEGFSMYISNKDEWFRTSTIIKINKDTFETKNSIYKYKFKEVNENI